MSQKEAGRVEASTDKIVASQPGQLDMALGWLNNHAWPLAGIILLTSVAHLRNYLEIERLPISMTSPALLSAIPVVFGQAALFVGVLTAFFLLPTVLLLTKIKPNGKSLIEAMYPEGQVDPAGTAAKKRDLTKAQRRKSASYRRSLGLRWVAGFVLYGLPLGLSGFIPIEIINQHPVLSSIFGIVALLAFTLAFVLLVTKIPLSLEAWKETSSDFLTICSASAFVQLVLMTYLVDASATVAGRYIDSMWIFLPILIGVLTILAFIQLFCAVIAHHLRSHQRASVVVLQIGIMLVMLSSLATAPSANAVRLILQVNGPDGRPCAVLEKKGGTSGRASDNAASDAPFQIPVRVLLEADGTYYVRKMVAADENVDLIPKDEVQRISACPPGSLPTE